MTATDLVIADLAAALVRVEAEAVIYRELAQVALEQLHDAEENCIGIGLQAQALREELRRYVSAAVLQNVP